MKLTHAIALSAALATSAIATVNAAPIEVMPSLSAGIANDSLADRNHPSYKLAIQAGPECGLLSWRINAQHNDGKVDKLPVKLKSDRLYTDLLLNAHFDAGGTIFLSAGIGQEKLTLDVNGGATNKHSRNIYKVGLGYTQPLSRYSNKGLTLNFETEAFRAMKHSENGTNVTISAGLGYRF